MDFENRRPSCSPYPTLVALMLSLVAVAAPAQDAAKPVPDDRLTEQESASVEALLAKVESDRRAISHLNSQLKSVDGLMRDIVTMRLDDVSRDMFKSAISVAQLARTQREAGKDVGTYLPAIRDLLRQFPGAAFETLGNIAGRIETPASDMPVVDRVAADQRFAASVRSMDDIYAMLVDYLELAQQFDVDAAGVHDEVVRRVQESAANRSTYLELATREAVTLAESVDVLPKNTDLPDQLSAARARARLTSNALQRAVTMLEELGAETYHYKQQLLTATGSLTTDVLDVNVMTNLVREWFDQITGAILDNGPGMLFRGLLIVAIVFVFYRAGKIVETLIGRAIDSSHVRVSHLLRRMLLATARNLMILLGILIALSQLDVSLGPLLAGLGIAGFIVGFAMQDALSNFASGILILFYRPFDVGDSVEAGGVFGKVHSMSLVNTTIMTFDNQSLVVPNNLIWQSVIKNLTAQHTRRIDLTFGISYSDDIEKAEKVFRDVVTSHQKVLDEPEPTIQLHELGDSSMKFVVRPWVRTEDYWEVYWDLMKATKLRLDAEGISIPFPQRDVHVHDTRSAEPG